MADVRLIDANKLERWLKTNMANANPLHCDIKETYSECITMVHCMETIDAVEVVRCRECKYYNRALQLCNNGLGARAYEFFCADGKKMDGGATNGSDQ